MADRRLHELPEGELEATLRVLAPAIAWPSSTMAGGSDIATAVRVLVERLPAPAGGPGPWRWSWRPARRALILALVGLLAVVAVAGALGLGLPGLRIILGEAPPIPTVSVSPSVAPTTPAPLGARLGLGVSLDPTNRPELDERAGFAVLLPADPTIGPPKTVYIDDVKGGQVTLLWPTRPDLPATEQRDVGLLISQFRGTVGDDFFMKATSSDTIIEPVQVDGSDGYWLTGDPHIFFWEGPSGFVDDARRWVGDVLLWSDGTITYRLETSLGRDRAIEIAESMR